MDFKNLVKFLKTGQQTSPWLKSTKYLGNDEKLALRYPPGVTEKPYIPESSSTLKEPMLLKEFQRWTGHRHKKTVVSSGKAQPSFDSLETNIHARIVRSPPRLEILTRTILPSDLMIKLGITSDNIMTPLGYKHHIRGPKAYVLCSRKALEMLGARNKRYLSIAYALLYGGLLSEVRRAHIKNDPPCEWREDAVEFYDRLTLEQIREEVVILKQNLESEINEDEHEEPDDHSLRKRQAFLLTPDLLLHLPAQELSFLLESLHISHQSRDDGEAIYLPKKAAKLMTLLYRYMIYNQPAS